MPSGSTIGRFLIVDPANALNVVIPKFVYLKNARANRFAEMATIRSFCRLGESGAEAEIACPKR